MPQTIQVYNALWNADITSVELEIACIQLGGRWRKADGTYAGAGLAAHYKKLQSVLWPEKKWHRWNDLLIKAFCENRIIGVLGPASSGKTHEAALFVLTTYYCFPDKLTVLCSSTEREMLEMRVWGEIKKYHRMAKKRFNWLPGYLIESRQRIVSDKKDESSEGRDFRNGICGVPCKKGGSFVGLGSFVGIKNEKVILVADEGQFMERAYLDAISNLNKNIDFKCIVMGNPKSTTDALGLICEPATELDGWRGGVDQEGGTKTWPIRYPNGICVQLVGTDCPNFDVPETSPVPFPFLITRKAISDDIAFYTKDSLQFTMMNEGRMPKGDSARRVINRAMCVQFKAFDQVQWDGEITRIGFLDAAYGNVGGDRCVFGQLQFGMDTTGSTKIALADLVIVPVSARIDSLPEDQIARWVRESCEERGITPENFFFDSTGRGTLMASFARNWSAYVIPVEFGGKPSRRPVQTGLYIEDKGEKRLKTCREHYSKFVTELWFSVRYCIEAGQFRGITEDLVLEGSSREWTMIRSNLIEVEPKAKTKERMGRSPDLFDALVAGVEGARQRGFVIGAKSASRSSTRNEDWLSTLAEKRKQLHVAHRLTFS